MKENGPANGSSTMTTPLASRNHPFRVYLGYDSHEDITYEVAKFSLEKNSSVPVHVTPLKRADLRAQGVYRREQDPKQSTEFTYCRFFVPYLNNYKGWALFTDDDFLFLGDLKDLKKLTLQSNSLDGTIPESFKRLTELITFRAFDNNLDGQIPPLKDIKGLCKLKK